MSTTNPFQTPKSSEHLLANIDQRLQSIEHRISGAQTEQLGWFDHHTICKLLHVSKRTLDTYRKCGLLPFSKIGGRVFFRKSDIETCLEQHMVRRTHGE